MWPTPGMHGKFTFQGTFPLCLSLGSCSNLDVVVWLQELEARSAAVGGSNYSKVFLTKEP